MCRNWQKNQNAFTDLSFLARNSQNFEKDYKITVVGKTLISKYQTSGYTSANQRVYLKHWKAWKPWQSCVNKVVLSWVKAHVNIQENEEADYMVKEGATGGMYITNIKSPHHCRGPTSNMKLNLTLQRSGGKDGMMIQDLNIQKCFMSH